MDEIAAGSLYVGSPETVARKIAATVRGFGAERFYLKYSAGTLPPIFASFASCFGQTTPVQTGLPLLPGP